MAYLPPKIAALIRVSRPIHWIKNLAVFAALIFTGHLYDIFPFHQALNTFVIFCLVTSATYIINDLFDVKLDRLHPTKKNRPLASGQLPVSWAAWEATILVFLGLLLASNMGSLFFSVTVSYLVLQTIYSLFLKNIPILDILIIAAGFVLRVYAGALAINTHLSVWFLLCVISVALFLASGKRRAELNIVEKTSELTRKSLTHYNKNLLNSYVTMFGGASWVSWAIFTFFESPKTSLDVWLFLAELSKTTTVGKLLMITIPVVIFGIMRYEYLIFEDRSETPEKILLTDRPLVVTVLVWTLLIIWIFYGGLAV